MVSPGMTPENLDRDAWTAAALEALEAGGLAAVAVEPLARRLNVTKGSFYWHFANRRELLDAMLERWKVDHVDAPLAALAGVDDPARRLRALADTASGKPPSIFIRLLDAVDDPAVRATVAYAAEARVAFLARAFRELGMTTARARRQALVFYSAYVGLAHLGRDAPEVIGDRRAVSRQLAELLIP
jgi:AcrR family transcriptional regulator